MPPSIVQYFRREIQIFRVCLSLEARAKATFVSQTESIMDFVTRGKLMGLLFTIILVMLFMYASYTTRIVGGHSNYRKGKDC